MKAGRTVSIRMPEGVVEELRALTGCSFSTLVRFTMLAYLERCRKERQGHNAHEARLEVGNEIRDIVLEQDLSSIKE